MINTIRKRESWNVHYQGLLLKHVIKITETKKAKNKIASLMNERKEGHMELQLYFTGNNSRDIYCYILEVQAGSNSTSSKLHNS